jgi:hypothetical protein
MIRTHSGLVMARHHNDGTRHFVASEWVSGGNVSLIRGSPDIASGYLEVRTNAIGYGFLKFSSIVNRQKALIVTLGEFYSGSSGTDFAMYGGYGMVSGATHNSGVVGRTFIDRVTPNSSGYGLASMVGGVQVATTTTSNGNRVGGALGGINYAGSLFYDGASASSDESAGRSTSPLEAAGLFNSAHTTGGCGLLFYSNKNSTWFFNIRAFIVAEDRYVVVANCGTAGRICKLRYASGTVADTQVVDGSGNATFDLIRENYIQYLRYVTLYAPDGVTVLDEIDHGAAQSVWGGDTYQSSVPTPINIIANVPIGVQVTASTSLGMGIVASVPIQTQMSATLHQTRMLTSSITIGVQMSGTLTLLNPDPWSYCLPGVGEWESCAEAEGDWEYCDPPSAEWEDC